jgi:hypothetical protein
MVLRLPPEHPSKAVSSVREYRPAGGWRGRWLVPKFVAAVVAFSIACASASPPGPSWIPGIYDDDDYDDVLRMVSDGAGVSDSQATQRVEWVLLASVLGAATGRIPRPTTHRQTIRGPPIERTDASADPLLTSATKALRRASIPLVSPPFRGAVRSFRSRASPLSPRGSDAWRWPGRARV